MLNQIYFQNKFDVVYCLKPGIICVGRALSGWERCRILKLHDNVTCDVLLIDVGITERISWYNLREIDERLIDYPVKAIRCSMIGINTARPIERYSLAIHETFRHILNTEPELYIFVNRSDVFSSHIFLYYKEKFNDKFICVNDIFPDETDFYDSSNELEYGANLVEAKLPFTPPMSPPPINGEIRQSTPMDYYVDVPTPPLPCETSKMDKSITLPEPVIVRHIKSFDEIYVFFHRYMDAFQKLHYDIQMHIENINFGSSFKFNLSDPSFEKETHIWNVKDHCLVIDPTGKQNEWLRGKIISIKTGEICLIYLRDFGKTIESKLIYLEQIPEQIRIVRDFAWTIQLAAVTPAKGYPNELCTQVLQDIIAMNKELAISAFNETDKNKRCVILWGIHEVTAALMPDRIEYININKKLVKQGVASTNISFDEVGKFLNIIQRDGDDSSKKSNKNDEDFSNEINLIDSDECEAAKQKGSSNISDEMEEVKTWLPSQPIKDKNFTAFPMYIRNNLAVSVLEAHRKTIADDIKQTLEEKKLANKLQKKNPIEWKIDDACFAQFKADGKYYRATIRRVNFAKNYCMVIFFLLLFYF